MMRNEVRISETAFGGKNSTIKYKSYKIHFKDL
jgi:hypothetical protein